jgi:three-Cys-motif partner protein
MGGVLAKIELACCGSTRIPICLLSAGLPNITLTRCRQERQTGAAVAENFFDEQADQSKVKTAIVSKYFLAWAKVISGHLKDKKDKRIAYIDLFAGPGRYKSGAKSTPVFILEQAIAEPMLRDNLVTLFNDGDEENTSSLIKAIGELRGIEKLKHKPQVDTQEVGKEIVKDFEEMNLIPTLMFVDPWGYKGLSLKLINSVLKDWACECIFFFNYTRINMGLSNDKVKAHMEALFGEERAAKLTSELEELSPDERELTIVERICEALIEMGGKFVLPFGFRNEGGTRTKHHLIFVSKHPLGYKIMKRVMYNESTEKQQGVATFEYSPATERQPLLFEYARPLDELEGMLLADFAGQTLTCGEIVEKHNYGRRYIDKNYKDVLTKMEQKGRVKGDPPHDKRRKGTCADHVKFTFPKRK